MDCAQKSRNQKMLERRNRSACLTTSRARRADYQKKALPQDTRRIMRRSWRPELSTFAAGAGAASFQHRPAACTSFGHLPFAPYRSYDSQQPAAPDSSSSLGCKRGARQYIDYSYSRVLRSGWNVLEIRCPEQVAGTSNLGSL